MKHSFGRSALAAVLALVAIVLAPMAFADVPPRQLTVATFNIKHGAGMDDVLDLERTAGVVEKSGADVIGLQEVDRHWSDRSDFADQAGWLARRLGMHVAYGANLDLDPANPGEPRRQYGTAILSRFPILDSRNTLLPRAEQGEQRGLLEARINVRGKKMLFLNTHLQHSSSAERSEQVAAINAIIDGRNLPTVLTGDLNATPEAPEIAELTERLADTWPTAGRGDGFTFDAAKPTMRIDYVLASREIDAHRAEVISTTVSDHRPVVVDITLR
ncbi:endonuclease/exonuclease/phosphatase family protein [Saccharopolyspora indica]|uniref:endonuclease/exonuclease/phosphatase family protein n=1 Tax=Saccharopolyspora indica TaxID=1229659 RepID=UPI0022EAF940|nr:endonuclease/exonuclease/phosphatase family protein [Saccharopolyspora indica]MDA3647776.1 endonuclease/exonuclease/phosphatase family protein [Saccharopolyspora indica]